MNANATPELMGVEPTGECRMTSATFDFRIDADSIASAQASIAALGRVLSTFTLSGELARHLRDLAPGAETAGSVFCVTSETFRHGALTIVESRLAPGDAYRDFVAALLSEHPHLCARHLLGWPILTLRPLAALPAGGAGAHCPASPTPVGPPG